MRVRPDTEQLTDLIYASLLGERSWQDFLDALRGILPNGKAFLFFYDAASGYGALPLSSGLDADALASYNVHYSTVNPWMQGASTRALGRVVRADAMLPRNRLTRTEFYSDFLRPQELESGIGVTILREQDCNFLLSVLSADADDAAFDDAVASVQSLVPHLRRAFDWYRRDDSNAAALFSGKGVGGSLRVGMITVGTGRKVRAVNGAAAKMLDGVAALSIDSVGRFRCTARSAVDYIDSVLSGWIRERCGPPPRTFLLPRGGAAPPLRLTVIAPPREPDAGYFRGPECIVLIEDPIRNLDVVAEEFGVLYRLTPAETRVVAGLATGLTLDEIATQAGIAPGTVRTQLKQVFAKTGISRQTDLIRNVCLLAGTVLDQSAIARTGSPSMSTFSG